MSATNIAATRPGLLPAALQTAQDSINLPEVQHMLRELSKYNLGIYMPHQHDEETGAFETLPEGFTQVENGLKVSFAAADQLVEGGGKTYLPIGWFWLDGARPMAVCTARCVMMGTMHTSGHDTSDLSN